MLPLGRGCFWACTSMRQASSSCFRGALQRGQCACQGCSTPAPRTCSSHPAPQIPSKDTLRMNWHYQQAMSVLRLMRLLQPHHEGGWDACGLENLGMAMLLSRKQASVHPNCVACMRGPHMRGPHTCTCHCHEVRARARHGGPVPDWLLLPPRISWAQHGPALTMPSPMQARPPTSPCA